MSLFFFFLNTYFLRVTEATKRLCDSLFCLFTPFLTALTLCFFSGSLSHRAGWEGLGRSLLRLQPHRLQSCPTWATTTWQGIKHSDFVCKTKGLFLFFFFSFFIWSTALVHKGRGHIHKAFFFKVIVAFQQQVCLYSCILHSKILSP